MKVLVFDTETTGLPNGRNPSILNTHDWPYIVQLSYIIYDVSNNLIIETFDNVIDLKDDVEITKDSIDIHGITKETCKSIGVPIKQCLNQFNNAIQTVDIVIGHNISFDKRVIMVECIRNNVQQRFNFRECKKPEYCTMMNGIDICKMEMTNQNGKKYFKYPKLSELHNNLFGEIPNGLHNSFVDILICLRCYVKMTNDYDIVNEERIKHLFIDYKI
jgi:DNA polymerase III epsilon subunit-like protein